MGSEMCIRDRDSWSRLSKDAVTARTRIYTDTSAHMITHNMRARTPMCTRNDICANARPHVHTHAHMHGHADTHAHTHVRTHMRTHTRRHTQTHTRLHTRMYKQPIGHCALKHQRIDRCALKHQSSSDALAHESCFLSPSAVARGGAPYRSGYMETSCYRARKHTHTLILFYTHTA